MKKHALITGINGQDGAYLSRFLLEKGYRVFGIIRRSTRNVFDNLSYLGIANDIDYIEGDLTDEASLINCIRQARPHEVYNLAAQSFVGVSWDQPLVTTEVNALGVLKLLSAIRNFTPTARFYQASTSEMFGHSHDDEGLQTEETPFHPRSPYAISKLYGYWIANNFKESYGMFCTNGILFNHESPIRGKEFVSRKISDGVARIKLGLAKEIRLGNIESRRDWGFAGDYVEAMWLILQQDEADNYIISTGETHSISDFLTAAFEHVGISDWRRYVVIDPAFRRPAELYTLQGKSDKARTKLGWTPRVRFPELVRMMVDADMERVTAEKKSDS